MILDWQSILGKIRQDEALDDFERAAKELEEARDEWYKAVYWANFASMHRN